MDHLLQIRNDFIEGVVKTNDGRVLARPLMMVDDLLRLALPGQNTSFTGGTGWTAFPEEAIGDWIFYVRTTMVKGHILSAHLVLAEPAAQPWDVTGERTRHEQLLHTIFGSPAEQHHAWGSIAVITDYRSGWAPICFRYAFDGVRSGRGDHLQV